MSSTTHVDFSVRQNKTIERHIVFDGLRDLLRVSRAADAVYVGLGSVWFVDFVLAHKLLAINTMISVESDPVIYSRAVFNRPYRTVDIREGTSAEVLPELRNDAEFASRPWIVWLDYDTALDESKLVELAFLVNDLPNNSVLLTTFNAASRHYGKNTHREAFFEGLFGDALVDDPFPDLASLKDLGIQMDVMARSTMNYLVAAGLQGGRAGGVRPAFQLMYQDGSPMVTVGVALPAADAAHDAAALLASGGWEGIVADPIATPPLTMKEVAALQAALPAEAGLTRADVVEMGFDLLETQVMAFATHYLRYPAFAQIAR